MDQNYIRELFSFSIAHTNFSNTAGLFIYEPTEEGLKTLNSYKLHFRNRDRGFVVAAECRPAAEEDTWELENQFREDAKLSFAVFTTDPYFFDKSELPYDPPGEYVYYFNNLDPAKRRTSLLLDKRGVEEDDKVKLSPKVISLALKKDDKDEVIKAKVYDVRGNLIPDTEYNWSVDTLKNLFVLDLNRKPDGLYTIEYDSESTTHYVCKASFIRRIPLIILEIFTGSDIDQDYSLIKREGTSQVITPKVFTLHFGSYKSIYWRYKITPCHLHWIWVQVKADQTEYTFSPEKVGFNKWHPPAVFTSDQAIDINPQAITVNLYRYKWSKKCRWPNHEYYYCDHNYGFYQNNKFMCRKHRTKQGKKYYDYECPAECDLYLIGSLPRPDEVTTTYIQEGEKEIALMELYLVKYQGKYIITDNPGQYPADDDDDDNCDDD